MFDRMTTTLVERALQRLGEVMEFHSDVEILLVGGAAAMLTNQLVGGRTTIDCDVMVYSPASAMGAVERAAERVAAELQLGPRWLNSDVQMLIARLPEGWERRRVLVCHSGRMRVWAASRVDLLAMKVIAGRAQDIEDVLGMKMRSDERAFVREHLRTVKERVPNDEDVAAAMELLEALEDHDLE